MWGVHDATNTTEPSMCGGDAACCQITLTNCYYIEFPLPSSRHHLSYDDGLEDKRENY